MTQSNCQRLASMLSAPALTGFLTVNIRAENYSMSSPLTPSLQAVDFVLMKCSKVHCANEYCFEDEVLNELIKLQLEGPDSQW